MNRSCSAPIPVIWSWKVRVLAARYMPRWASRHTLTIYKLVARPTGYNYSALLRGDYPVQ